MKHSEMNQIERLAQAAIAKYDICEVLDALFAVSDTRDRSDICDWAVQKTAENGGVILRPKTLVEKEQTERFIDELYPCYNQQRNYSEDLFALL